MGSGDAASQLPLTCPACGAPVPWVNALRRHGACPGCHREITVAALWGHALFWGSVAGPFACLWAAGVRGLLLAAAGTALILPAGWALTGAPLASWPPRLRLREPAPRRRHQFGHWFGTEEPPITLGLSAPPPQPKPGEKPKDDSC